MISETKEYLNEREPKRWQVCLKGSKNIDIGVFKLFGSHRLTLREDSLEEGMAMHSSILPGESHGQRSLGGYSPWDHTELDMTEVAWHILP